MRATDSGLVSAMVLLDLSTAFDTVDHRILLDVLSSRFGVTDGAYEWFSSYPTGRTQVISTNTSTSEAVLRTCDVPQGSVVGPQQFTAYTEDVEELIESFDVIDHLYAYDSEVLTHMHICEVQCRKSNIDRRVLTIQDGCFEKQLQLNPDKTEMIWFGSRTNVKRLSVEDLELRFYSVVIKPSFTVRDIGVWLDSVLTMRDHILRTFSTCFQETKSQNSNLSLLAHGRVKTTNTLAKQKKSSLLVSQVKISNRIAFILSILEIVYLYVGKLCYLFRRIAFISFTR